MIDKGIHLAWAYPGCVWILRGIRGDTIICETPKTKKIISAKASDAMYTRAWEPQRHRSA